VSDGVSTPKLSVAINLNTNEVTLLWLRLTDAKFYEIDRTFDSTLATWELIAIPDTNRYFIGNFPAQRPVFYRGRAVFSSVVSRWGNTVQFD
jgi:hypothetical protein